MKHGQLISLNVGMPTIMQYNQKDVATGIIKIPVYERLELYWEHFEGDGQADLKHHGGKDKAVCVYGYEHYSFWEQELGRPLPFGAFGENLTISGLLEPEVCIGDIFQLGNAIVQISQPRQPCFKLAALYQSPKMPLKVQETGFTGFYFRVLQRGTVNFNDKLIRLLKHPQAITVEFANRVMHHDKNLIDDREMLLSVLELSASWRSTLEKRGLGIKSDNSERLIGRKQTEK
ncbi:MOSC domain-containing protein [Paenibacillus psychroresistens]|uniref:MOSC domain-containing protein n=1 Tax=Paenibacillus psychroresistens TaxID=1778678 RepID=A0A6B8RI08_9BACL|nr:MOSC domain-containing protein [Paenibacillus psychroresistens]QGQ96091.1 MOSC domain-containing protein [Paenibacillus psychroresistens]